MRSLSRGIAVVVTGIAMLALLASGRNPNRNHLQEGTVDHAVAHHHHDGHDHGHDHHHGFDDVYDHHDGGSVGGFNLNGLFISAAHADETQEIPDEFVWKHRADLCGIDDTIKAGLAALHGGSAEDPETGIIYTCFPGAGLYALDKDLKQWKLVEGSSPEFKSANSHGICVFKDGAMTKLGIASTNTGTVYITGLNGVIESRLTMPEGYEFDDEFINDYYGNRLEKKHGLDFAIQIYGAKLDKDKKPIIVDGKMVPNPQTFSPTCVSGLDGILYVSTGYSTGDFILTAKNPHTDAGWAWDKIAWGSRHKGEYPHNTAHGVVARKDPSGRGDEIWVASRGNFRVYVNKPDGTHIDGLNLPNGALVCNTSHAGGVLYLPDLGPLAAEKEKTASVLIYIGKERVGRLNPGEHGLDPFPHIHHVLVVLKPGSMGEKTPFAIAQGWNKGNIAIFELQEIQKGRKKKII